MKPDLVWECRGTTARLNRAARFDADGFVDQAEDPLASLRALIAESRIELPPELPPMAAGLFGYLGYDMVRLVEHLPDVNPDPLGLADAVMIRPSVVLVVDGVKGEVTVVSPAWANSGLNPRAAYAQAAERVMDAVRDLDRTPAQASRDLGDLAPGAPVSNTSHARYLEIVEAAKEYIRAGDIFQVVPSQRWAQPFALPPFALYRALRRTNPSPFMFYFNFGGFQVIGASPEILVRVKDGKVTIRPIAGTRPRGATPAEDARSRPSCSPTPRSGPSTSCWSTSAATTSAASRGSARSISTNNDHRALQPRHAHRLQRRRRARRRP